ncbi:MAG: hypothetical protein ACO1NS_13280 [Daejeonella sp.]|uniref:hypothetical protein n=1 Tax=Daejeonella sp. JGW-45 TaxID=3034148 RepID=UPI0023EAFEBE|nr:hypothetical protein [Daejeonella sp. JGW-45]
MKRISTLLALLIWASATIAQSIKYEKSFEAAQAKAREQNKLLCLLITTKPAVGVSQVLTGLDDPAIVKIFTENFVGYKVDRSDSASRPLIRANQLTGFPAFAFFDSKGGLLFKQIGNLPAPLLTDMFNRALAEKGKESIIDLDEKYKTGDRSNAFLKNYINRRMNAGIDKNAELIEEYVKTLTINDLEKYGEVLFVLKAGPFIDGRAYGLINTNRKLVDSIFKREIYDVRAAINRRMIENTLESAIAEKNITRASAVRHFTTMLSSKTNPVAAWAAGDRQMLRYYSGIKDTAQYLAMAVRHYDQHYMRLSADSIRKLTDRAQEVARSRANELAELNRPTGAAVRSVSYTYANNLFAAELNNGAYSVYTTKTTNPKYLMPALQWVKRSIELRPTPESYDTLAHLHYRLGHFAEAEASQLKAVELGKAAKGNITILEASLKKMKSRTL